MKERKLFDFGLYREGFKQLKTPGIVFFILFTIAAVAVPLAEVIEGRGNYIKIVIGMDMHPILLGLIIVAFILTLYLFSFLNKRNTADFYHAMPYTRECVFISLYASILTWLIIIAAVTSLISLGLHSIFSDHFAVVFSSWFMFTLNCLAASFLAAACTALACTITGTTINGIIIAVLIMFLPRFVISLITREISLILPMMSNRHIGFLLEGKYNLLAYILFEALGMFNWFNDILADATACIYTVVLSLLYAVAACFLFKKRKSETAGQSSPNRVMQTIFRITVTMTVCIVVLCYIIDVRSGSVSSKEVFFIILGYLVAVFVYFLYELVTTKKWKNLLKAVPALGIVILLNVLFYLGMLGLYQAQLNFTPTADEITSVSLQVYDMGNSGLSGYYKYQSADIELTDERIKQIVAKSLKENVDVFKSSRDKFTNTYWKSIQDYSSNTYDSYSISDPVVRNVIVESDAKYTRACVKIRTKGGTYYRKVIFPSDEFKTIESAVLSNPEFQKRVLTLPEPVRNTITFGYSDKEHSDKAAYEVFKTMQNELSSIDAGVWLSLIDSKRLIPTHISYRTVINNKEIYISAPILPDLTPKSYEMYLEYTYNMEKSERKTVLSMLKSGEYKKYDSSGNFMLKTTEGTFKEVRLRLDDETIHFLLDNMIDEKITVDDSYVCVELRYGEYYIGYFNLGKLTYEDIKDELLGSKKIIEEDTST